MPGKYTISCLGGSSEGVGHFIVDGLDEYLWQDFLGSMGEKRVGALWVRAVNMGVQKILELSRRIRQDIRRLIAKSFAKLCKASGTARSLCHEDYLLSSYHIISPYVMTDFHEVEHGLLMLYGGAMGSSGWLTALFMRLDYVQNTWYAAGTNRF